MIAVALAVALVAGQAVQALPDAPAAPLVKASLPAAPGAAALPDMNRWDPEHPPAAWLRRMVRPCARSGNRLVC